MTSDIFSSRKDLDHEQAVRELREACRVGDFVRVQELFQRGLLDATDATHTLEDAFQFVSNAQLIRYLLEHGADANAFKDIRWVKSIEVIKLLTEFGYDIKSHGHKALQQVSETTSEAENLLDRGVDINKLDTNRNGRGYFLVSSQYDYSLPLLNNVAAEGNIQLFDHLVARGADPMRSMALHCASKCEDAERSTATIQHLLDKYLMPIGANNRALCDWLGVLPGLGTPLHSAIWHKNLAAVRELLDRGADVDGPGDISIVGMAVGNHWDSEGWLPALEPVLQAGVNVDEALSEAALWDNWEAARICLERGAIPARAFESEVERIAWLTENEVFDSDERNMQPMNDEIRKLLEDWDPSRMSGEVRREG